MYRYAICNSENKVVNIIKWDGISNWTPPENHYAIKVDGIFVDMGYIYNKETQTFSKPLGE